MGYFGNRNSGGMKTYGSGIAYLREIDATGTPVTGSTSAWTQIGYFKNIKFNLPEGTPKDFIDDSGLAVTTYTPNPVKGEVALDLMERDSSVRTTFSYVKDKYFQLCWKGATLTYSGTKTEYWLVPFMTISQGFEYAPDADDVTWPLKAYANGAKKADTIALPGSLSASSATVALDDIFVTADV